MPNTPLVTEEQASIAQRYAEQLRAFWAESNGTSLHIAVADFLDSLAMHSARQADEGVVERVRDALSASECVGIEKGKIVSIHFLEENGGVPLFQLLSEMIAENAAIAAMESHP